MEKFIGCRDVMIDLMFKFALGQINIPNFEPV